MAAASLPEPTQPTMRLQTTDQTPAGTAAANAARPVLSRGATAGLALATLLSALGAGSPNVALPTLAAAFDAPFARVQWVVLAYLLVVTAFVVSAGRLGDLVGHRRLLLGGIAVFVAGSFAGGVAPSLGWLIAARALQGVGAASMLALTLALVAATGPQGKTGGAMGLLGAMSALGTALGPSLGGVLVAQFGWRSVFFVNVPLGLLALGFAGRGLPADVRRSGGARAGLDPVGTALFAVSLTAYALAMMSGRGRFGASNAAWLLAAGLVGGLFLYVETRASAPLLRLATLRNRALSVGLAGSALVSTVLMTSLVVGPFYLTRALGLDAARVGLVLAVGPTVAALVGVPAGRLVDRAGARRVTLGGLAGIALGSLALAAMPRSCGVAGYLGALAVITAGYALFQTANNTAVMAEATGDQRGVVSGMLNLSRNLGLVTGASLMGAVFAGAVGARDLTTAAPADVAFGLRATFLVAAALIFVAGGIAAGVVGSPTAPDARRPSGQPSGALWK